MVKNKFVKFLLISILILLIFVGGYKLWRSNRDQKQQTQLTRIVQNEYDSLFKNTSLHPKPFKYNCEHHPNVLGDFHTHCTAGFSSGEQNITDSIEVNTYINAASTLLTHLKEDNWSADGTSGNEINIVSPGNAEVSLSYIKTIEGRECHLSLTARNLDDLPKDPQRPTNKAFTDRLASLALSCYLSRFP